MNKSRWKTMHLQKNLESNILNSSSRVGLYCCASITSFLWNTIFFIALLNFYFLLSVFGLWPGFSKLPSVWLVIPAGKNLKDMFKTLWGFMWNHLYWKPFCLILHQLLFICMQMWNTSMYELLGKLKLSNHVLIFERAWSCNSEQNAHLWKASGCCAVSYFESTVNKNMMQCNTFFCSQKPLALCIYCLPAQKLDRTRKKKVKKPAKL